MNLRRVAFLLVLMAVGVSLAVPAFSAPPAKKAPIEERLASEKTEGLLSKLLAPGAMIPGHADLEHTQCLKCHVPRQGVPDANCLACHKEVKEQVDRRSGFHGLTRKTCIQCHIDHKGRKHDTTVIDTKKFKHEETGYVLVGKHAALKCTECHTEKRSAENKKLVRLGEPRYMGLKVSCVSCHRKHDVHKFSEPFASRDCGTCHGVKTWKTELKFDHEKDGKFRLEGKHSQLKCAKCHLPKEGQIVYKWPELPQAKCLSCHKNIHGEKLGAKFQGGECNKCHGSQSWKIEKFDHAVTGYPLRGKHAPLDCVKCHKQQPQVVAAAGRAKGLKKDFRWAGLKQDCLSCHKDFHFFGEFKSQRTPAPNQCLGCHGENTWKEIHHFNHDTSTAYRLEGKHEKVACAKCHKPQGAAAEVRGAPRPETRQDTRPWIYQFPNLQRRGCVSCHRNIHQEFFTAKTNERLCSDCHVVHGWALFDRKTARFTHDKVATRFLIDGKHEELECRKCHIREKKQVFRFQAEQKAFCIDCHKNVHEKQFTEASRERSCQDCHFTSEFRRQRPFDHEKTQLPLRGKHAKAKCERCHVDTPFMLESKPPRPARRFIFAEMSEKNCAACHKDPHLGAFGAKCAECHGDDSWKKSRDFHREFKLSGVHYSLKCDECHQGGKRLGGMSENCLLCHQKDDVHHGGLPACGSCHRQQFWESTEFKHSLTRFPLRGIHRTLECMACHRGGVYQGTPGRCVDCHLNDALSATLPPHNPLLLQRNCAECHNQFVFR